MSWKSPVVHHRVLRGVALLGLVGLIGFPAAFSKECRKPAPLPHRTIAASGDRGPLLSAVKAAAVRAKAGIPERPPRKEGGGEKQDTVCELCPVVKIDCGEAQKGDLGPDDCTLDDGSSIDIYRLDLDVARLVSVTVRSVDFDTFLFVANAECESIASNDDCQPGDLEQSCITTVLAPGGYFILVNSFAAGGAGQYSLEAIACEATPCELCVIEDVSCGETKMGTLAGDDCLDVAGVSQDLYRLELAEDARVAVEVNSAAFDTWLMRYDEHCFLMEENDDCIAGDTSRSCLSVDLEAGTHLFAVSSFDAGEQGEYTFTVECLPGFSACTDCVVSPIECGGTVAGTFPASNCTRLTGEGLDLYPFELAASGPVSVTLASEAFDTFLILYNADCEEIALNDDCDVSTTGSCLSGVELDAGAYFIGVSSFEAGVNGDFSLELACPDISFCRECEGSPVSCGASVEGALEPGDCTGEDAKLIELHRLELTDDPSNLVATAQSASFEPVVTLYDQNCAVVASSDACPDSDPGISCLELRQLPAGSYYVGVSAATEGTAGSYNLSVECSAFEPCIDCIAGEIGCEGEVGASLDPEDCELSDGSRYDIYPLKLAAGSRVTIAMSSLDLDPFLFLLDGSCLEIATNDNCDAVTTSACLTVDLAPGEYFIVATSSAGGEVGSYIVSVQCTEIPLCRDCKVGTLQCGQPVSGSLPTSGCTLVDETSIDVYEFVMPADGQAEFTLRSTAFDTYLLLFDESCVFSASNDDCLPGEADRSCLAIDLTAGTYYVGVNSFSPGEAGEYTVHVAVPGCGAGNGQIPGDCNQDGGLNVDDAVCLLGYLFLGDPSALPCTGGGGLTDPNLALADWQGDGMLTIADAVALARWLFAAAPGPAAHVLDPNGDGRTCVPIEGCPAVCAGAVSPP